MRTIKEIKAEISETENDIKSGEHKKAAETRLRKHIAFLQECIRCIESEPDENFIKDQIVKVETKINLRMRGFDLDMSKIDKRTYSQMRRAYEKEHEIPKLRNQIRSMKFLLA